MNLNQITVPSTNVERSARFYEKLGLRLIVEAFPHYVRFQCPDGDATFSVHLVEEQPSGEGISVYFEMEQLDNRVDELLEVGVEFDEMPEERPWLWREARLRDPDGNRLILYHAGENRKNPPWRIS
jgi:catechol 2,3-dioxygenase-like lactoylglutathione lyase family enzyme